METLMAVVIGVVFASGLYLMLRRNIVKLVVGLALVGHAANLLVFTAAGYTRGRPPLVPEGAAAPPAPVADPLPQALVLTAIVIGFGVLAFALVMVQRTHAAVGTEDVDRMRTTDTL